MFSIEDGKDCRIRSEKYLTNAIEYAITDENAKEIFEYNDEDNQCLGCVWVKDSNVKCTQCGCNMNFIGCDDLDNYIELEYSCSKCGSIASFKAGGIDE